MAEEWEAARSLRKPGDVFAERKKRTRLAFTEPTERHFLTLEYLDVPISHIPIIAGDEKTRVIQK